MNRGRSGKYVKKAFHVYNPDNIEKKIEHLENTIEILNTELKRYNEILQNYKELKKVLDE